MANKTTTRLVSAAFLIQILLCMPLWFMQGRTFLAVPLLPVGSALVHSLSPLLAGLLCLCLFFRVLLPQQIWLRWFTLGILALLIGLDVHRLQVWVWFYLLYFLFFEHSSNGFRLLAAFLYLWAGLHKINLHFFQEVVPEWLSKWPDLSHTMHILFGGATIGLELAIGIGLLFYHRSKWVYYALVLLHLGIFTHLAIVLEWNVVVLPWNILLPLALLLLYFRNTQVDDEWWQDKPLLAGSFLAGAMPAAFVLGLWPYTLSWAMYSGLHPEMTYAWKDGGVRNLPEAIQKKVFVIDGEANLVLDDWTFEEANVPPFAAGFVFARMHADWCLHGQGMTRWTYLLRANRFDLKSEKVQKISCPNANDPYLQYGFREE